MSPTDGTVLARNVNPGQVVGAGQEIFTVADLRTVWVIGDVYEKDFGAETSEQFQKMELFNPDESWEVVADDD